MEKRTCAHCGTDIAGLHANSRYCSSKCREAANWERAERLPCNVCGAPTGWKVSSGRSIVTHKACSRHPCGTPASYRKRKCRCEACTKANRDQMRAYYAKRKAEGRPMGKGRKRNKTFAGTCEHCGSEFRSEQQQRFCSMRCFGASNRKTYSTELVHVGPVPEVVAPPAPVTVVTAPRSWNVLVYGPCAWCEEPFIGIGRRSRYCSRQCQKASGDARRGEFVVKPRFRFAIYQRDDWTCQLCFEPVDKDAAPLSDWRASLDHIVPRSKGGDDSWDNLRLTHRWCNAIRGAGDYHSDLFEAVTTGGSLGIGPDRRPAEDAA